MFLLCKHVRLTCGFNKLMMTMMMIALKVKKTRMMATVLWREKSLVISSAVWIQ